MKTGKRYRRQALGAPEYHVPVQVTHLISGRGVFVGGKGGELPRLVKLIRRVNAVRPGRPGDGLQLLLVQRAIHQICEHRGQEGGKNPGALEEAEGSVVVWSVEVMQGLGNLGAGEIRIGVGRLLQQSHEHGVIGDRIKIQGLAQLDLVTRRMVYGFTPGISVGVIGGGNGAECVGVEGVARMHMQIAKIGVAIRVVLTPLKDRLVDLE